MSTELVTQRGLPSTPFHRVYFRETGGAIGTAKTELLPRQRYKYSVGLRLNNYATDLAQLRRYYRFYNDNFGIRAHTATEPAALLGRFAPLNQPARAAQERRAIFARYARPVVLPPSVTGFHRITQQVLLIAHFPSPPHAAYSTRYHAC